jgi:hypothetical protein
MKHSCRTQNPDGSKINKRGRKDSKCAADIELPEGDATKDLLFFKQPAADKQTADCKKQINPAPAVIVQPPET